MKKFVITIARGFGSRGKKIAVKLGEELGIHCYEKEILELASEKSGINRELFVARDERLKGNYLMNIMKPVPLNYAVEPMDKRFTHDSNLFNIQKEIIQELAEEEPCIIVGKCADDFLSTYQKILRVYIHAPLESCIKEVVERMGVSKNEAERLILKTDKYRSDYYRYYTHGKNWSDPGNYDLCVNTGYMSEAACVKIIKEALVRKYEGLMLDEIL